MIITSNLWDTKIIRKKLPPIKYKIIITNRKASDKIELSDWLNKNLQSDLPTTKLHISGYIINHKQF